MCKRSLGVTRRIARFEFAARSPQIATRYGNTVVLRLKNRNHHTRRSRKTSRHQVRQEYGRSLRKRKNPYVSLGYTNVPGLGFRC